MNSIMEVMGPEVSELSALELEKLPYLTLFRLASANIDQSVPNLATIYMPLMYRMGLIMGQIEPEPEHLELFALEFGNIAEYDFVYTLSSTNINRTTRNVVKMFVIIKSRMSSILQIQGKITRTVLVRLNP